MTNSFDRFIPFRASNGRFHFVPSVETVSTSRQAYRMQLAEALGLNGRVLSFRSTSPPPRSRYDNVQPRRVQPPSRRIPQGPERKLDAPEIVDDFYLNLLDWGTCNVLAIALGQSVYLWDDSTASVSELMLFDEPVTSLSWAPDARQLAVGLNNAQVQLWDTQAIRRVSTLEGFHQSRVGSLAWNSHILTTGGMDGRIINNDVRIPSPAVATYKGHRQEVCGLKWSPSGNQLASSGCDSLVHIWDRSTTRCLHRLRGHTSAVKALAWCPFKTNLLATGDRTLKFWNTQTGACLNSLDTAFHASSLLWSNKERELLSSNGHQLTLWNYPSMDKMAEIAAHTSTVLFMTQSPNDCTVATAAAGEDETLRFWNVFGVPEAVKKRAPRALPLPFSHLSRIR